VCSSDLLPADSAANAARLVELIKPRAAIFVKYEFWFHHLHALKARAVPLFLVSAIFRKGQPFFKWYGGAWRSMLACYTHIFTQDERSRGLLSRIGVKDVSVGGDTRFDRVRAIVDANGELPEARAFKESSTVPVLVCGSTWLKDDQLIHEALEPRGHNSPPFLVRCIVVPHEIVEAEFEKRMPGYPGAVGRWSDGHVDERVRTLFVDRMGLLARLYKYGDIAYVGGGFTDGIHSILEAAAWGRPVIFGPKHTKFAEAEGLIGAGGGFEVRNAGELRTVLEQVLGNREALAKASEAAANYVRARTGATARIVGPLLSRIRV
jgi:3-deoxy-D-manno-octulosonic-acid transferase